MSRTTERVGRSGEYFVAALLSQISDTVLIVPHSAEADVLFQYNNTLYKVQVKTKTKIEKHRANWRFDMRRGSHTKNRNYEDGAIDIFAFVSLHYNQRRRNEKQQTYRKRLTTTWIFKLSTNTHQ
jgi:hypothetical protein